MKPEEKFFVTWGIQEDFQYYHREEGYWLCRKEDDGYATRLRFYRIEKEANEECQKLREAYKKFTKTITVGKIVWFMDKNLIHKGKVKNIINIGDELVCEVDGSEKDFDANELFGTLEEITTYLLTHIQEN